MSRTVKRGVLNQTHDRVFDAVVIDVVRDRCSVQLAGNGQLLRGLRYSGGPLQSGDKCKVSYASGAPLVMGMGRVSVVAVQRNAVRSRAAHPDYSAAQLGAQTGAHGHPEIRIVSSDGSMQFFPATANGLAAAEAAQVSGDLIVIPERTTIVFTSFSLAAGVSLAGADLFTSTLQGRIVLVAGSTLRSLGVELSGSSSGNLAAVEMTGSGLALILDCNIAALNSGAGNAYAVVLNGDATSRIELWDCSLQAQANAAAARVFYSAVVNGGVRASHCALANTDNLADTPDDGWKIAEGVEAKVYGCSWQDRYTPGVGELVYLTGDRASERKTGQVLFTAEGGLAVATGSIRIYNCMGRTVNIDKVFLSVSTAPVGAAITVDVNKDGTTIFTTQANRPQIAAAAFTGQSTTIEVASWANGEYLTMDIDQVGSTTAGSDLTVHIVYG